MAFPFLTIFIVFIIWLALRYQKLYRIQDEKMESFWEKERAANATPARDISNLSYLTIPLDKFPLNFSSDEDVLAIENELKELATHKLLNLTGMTNTDLKATYGVPNFEAMSQMGDDFDRVSVLLNSYGKALIEADRIDDAITVLEYAAGVKTDVSESYVMLANCYRAKNNTMKLEYLRTQISESDLMLKNSILDKIKD